MYENVIVLMILFIGFGGILMTFAIFERIYKRLEGDQDAQD